MWIVFRSSLVLLELHSMLIIDLVQFIRACVMCNVTVDEQPHWTKAAALIGHRFIVGLNLTSAKCHAVCQSFVTTFQNYQVKGQFEFFWPVSFCLLFRLKWLKWPKNVKTPQVPMLVSLQIQRVDRFYLDAGKLGLKEFCSLVKCLHPAPLSPGSQPQKWGYVNREWDLSGVCSPLLVAGLAFINLQFVFFVFLFNYFSYFLSLFLYIFFFYICMNQPNQINRMLLIAVRLKWVDAWWLSPYWPEAKSNEIPLTPAFMNSVLTRIM